MKRLISGFLIATLALGLIPVSACAKEHTHTYSEKWSYDGLNHWRVATCEHTDEYTDKGLHEYNGGTTCVICGYTVKQEAHTHTGVKKYKNGGPTCTKGDDWTMTCVVCGEEVTGTDGKLGHDFVETVIRPYDCLTGGETLKECSRCETSETETIPPRGAHEWVETAWEIGAATHWHKCLNCSARKDEESHSDLTGGTPCDECGYRLTETQGLTFEPTADGTSYVVTGFGSATGETLVIPGRYEVNGLNRPVTEIADLAFGKATDRARLSLKSVVIPASVEKIGQDAFASCTKLSEVVVLGGSESKLGSIGKDAFSNTAFYNDLTNWTGEAGDRALYLGDALIAVQTNKTSFNVKDGVRLIADGAFSEPTFHKEVLDEYGCKNLTELNLPSTIAVLGKELDLAQKLARVNINGDSGKLFSRDGVVYRNVSPSLVSFEFVPAALAGDITVPDKVKYVGDSLFVRRVGLLSVRLPDTLEGIGEVAFSGCGQLRSIEFGNGLKTIGSMAFMGCKSLTSVSFPATLNFIGYLAFGQCEELVSATFADPVGWTVTGVDTSGGTSPAPLPVGADDLRRENTAARYLTGDNVNKNWSKGSE